MANFILNEFLKEFSKRAKIDFNILQYALPFEIKKILFGENNSQKFISKRLNGMAHVMTSKKEDIIVGAEYKKLDKLFHKKEMGEIKGIIGSIGYAKGKARIIIDPKNAINFRKGNILVAGMTRPDFVPLMKKAAAIVTDEGGITCHAAIVSRELGIPCIIGTKNATRVLKDGDLVEVDANKGVVKKLEK